MKIYRQQRCYKLQQTCEYIIRWTTVVVLWKQVRYDLIFFLVFSVVVLQMHKLPNPSYIQNSQSLTFQLLFCSSCVQITRVLIVSSVLLLLLMSLVLSSSSTSVDAI